MFIANYDRLSTPAARLRSFVGFGLPTRSRVLRWFTIGKHAPGWDEPAGDSRRRIKAGGRRDPVDRKVVAARRIIALALIILLAVELWIVCETASLTKKRRLYERDPARSPADCRNAAAMIAVPY